MKKFILTLCLLSLSTLFGQTISKKIQVQPDEIEILVNNFLSKKSPHVHKQHVGVGRYFVQMFAYSQKKPVGLIQKIRQRGYKTISKEVWRNDKQVNLLLVGPYQSRAEVKQHLAGLKSISKGAFIFVTK